MVFNGKYKTGEQILRLVNERFAVPEMLFHPSDIGIQEMGIPESIVHSIQSLPEGQSRLDLVVSFLAGTLQLCMLGCPGRCLLLKFESCFFLLLF